MKQLLLWPESLACVLPERAIVEDRPIQETKQSD